MDKGKIVTMTHLWDEIIDAAAKEILAHSPQLFHKDEFPIGEIKPEPLASGVLIRVQGESFLVTAAHILKNIRPEDIGIMVGNTFIIMNGFVMHSKDFDNDKIDLAVWKIDEDIISDIEVKYRFLEIGKVDYAHLVTKEPRYLVVGFPASQTKKDKRRRILKPKPFIFLDKEADKKYYQKLGFEETQSILINYQKRKIKSFETGYINFGPDPQGISGCGLWYLPSFPPFEELIRGVRHVDYKLVGIMMEHRNRNNLMIATRIHLVTEILRTKLKMSLPTSRICRIKE